MGFALIDEITEASVAPDSAALWWLGQMGFAIKLGQDILYFDFFLGDDPNRLIVPVCSPACVTNATCFFGTHDHGDHIDRKVWPAFAKASPTAKFVIPRGHQKSLIKDLEIQEERFIGLNGCESIEFEGLKISAIPASHEFLEQDTETGLYPHLCYIVQSNGITIFHAGDTVIYEGMYAAIREFTPIDIMILPINGRDGKRLREGCIGNMTFQEAADLAGALKPGVVIPAHYDMFANNLGSPDLFAEMLDIKYPNQKYHIPTHYQKYEYHR